MKNHESIRSRLQNADDETLKRMILTVASASGMSEENRNALIGDIPKLRRLLTETDEKKLNELISSMKAETVAEALKALSGRKK